VEIPIAKIWEYVAGEQLQKVMHILCSCEARRWKRDSLVDVTKTNTSGLIDEYNVGILAPSIFVVHGSISRLIDEARPQLAQQSNHA
jgi:hypothetical protein